MDAISTGWVRSWRRAWCYAALGSLGATLLLLLQACSDSSAVATNTEFFIDGPAVAYQPRGYVPGREAELPSVGIDSDLQLLRDAGFRGLVTYSSLGALGKIPEMARSHSFDGPIVMGIWDPTSTEELNNAIAQAPFVSGYCVGNEGLDVRYTREQLAATMDELRRRTGRPVTTTEPVDSYLGGPHRNWLIENSDWLFPLAHPVWANRLASDEAVDWVIARHDYLVAATGRQVVFKELGLPTGGRETYSEAEQTSFFKAIKESGLSFFYFEAFDQPWKGNRSKPSVIEAHWGLFRADGTPKEAVASLAAWRDR